MSRVVIGAPPVWPHEKLLVCAKLRVFRGDFRVFIEYTPSIAYAVWSDLHLRVVNARPVARTMPLFIIPGCRGAVSKQIACKV